MFYDLQILKRIVLLTFSLIWSTLSWELLYISLYGLFPHKEVTDRVKNMAEMLSGLTKGAIPAVLILTLDAGQVWSFLVLIGALMPNMLRRDKKFKSHENVYILLGFLYSLFPAELSALVVGTLTLCLTLGYIPLVSIIIFSPIFFLLIYITELSDPLAVTGYALLLLWSLTYSKKRVKHQFIVARVSLRNSRSRRKIYRYLGLVFPLILFPLAGRSGLVRVLQSGTFVLWILELTRFLSSDIQKFVMTLMKPVSKKYEKDRISGTTLYFTGCAIASLFPGFTGPVAIVMATLGDAWAMLVGSRWGRTALYRKKSMEGSLACLAVCATAGWLFLFFYGRGHPQFFPVIAGALAATLAELYSGKLDNVIMPPAAALAIYLLL